MPRSYRLPTGARAAFATAASLVTGAAVVAATMAPSTAYGAASASIDRHLTDSRILESSGLARSGYDDNVLWTHNDSGDSARLFSVSRSGSTRGVLTLTGAKAVDWEAMARHRLANGSSYLYVGDIGDNGRSRSEVQVYRVAEPRTAGNSSAPATTFRLRYPDGRHDAEALLVHPRSGRLYIATKHYNGGSLYAAPSTLSTTSVNTLSKIGSAPSVVTDGTFLWDGRIVLRNYTTGFIASAPGRSYRSFGLPSSPQGESITSAPGWKSILTGSEGRSSALWKVSVPPPH